jgi:hypothetical protein
MSDILTRIVGLVRAGDYETSRHANRRMNERGISLRDILSKLPDSTVVEEYPDAFDGPSVLIMCHDEQKHPVHSVWGLRKGTDRPAVLVTVYHPGLDEWERDYRTRRP